MKLNGKRLIALLATLCLVIAQCTVVAAEPVEPQHEHVYKLVVLADDDRTYAPTCETDGIGRYVCQVEGCGVQGEYDIIPATGHDWQQVEAEEQPEPVPATCTTDGKTSKVFTYICANAGHKEGETEGKPADRTEETVIPALGHDLTDVEWEEDKTDPEWKDATCKEDGLAVFVKICNTCGEKVERKTEVLPHEEVEHTPKDAVDEPGEEGDCRHKGYHYSVVYCETCGAQLSKTKVEDAEFGEHDWGTDRRNVVPATCHSYEVWDEYRVCNICGEEELIQEGKQGTVYADHTLELDEGAENVEPTCVDDGVHFKWCKVCGLRYEEVEDEEIKKLFKEIIPATGVHTWGQEITIPATCMVEGSIQRMCEVCGLVDIVEVLPIDTENGHDWQPFGEASRPATCTKKGVEAEKCSICGARRATDTDALGHELMMLEAIEPTCEDPGWTVGWYCTRENCDGDEVALPEGYPGEIPAGAKLITAPEKIDPLGHKELKILEYDPEPTCTEVGYKTIVCARCGEEVENVEVPALGHNFVIRVPEEDVEATCVESGYYVFYCTNCGMEKREYVEATGEHQWGPENKDDPTCKEAGRIYSVCQVCGYVDEREFLPIDENAHVWTEEPVEMKKEPTCTENGIGKYECTLCGVSEWREIEAFGHDPVDVPGIEPTCVDGGRTGGVVCARCEEMLEEPEDIDPLGHDWKSGEIQDATCIKPGSVKKLCKRCGEETTDIGVYGDHTWVAWPDYDIAPTCVSAGAKGYVCFYCDATKYEPTGKSDPTAHVWVKLEQISVPTCVSGALDLYACYFCDARVIKESETSKADPSHHVWCDVGDKMACYYCDATKAK
jgi:hypothetical protein